MLPKNLLSLLLLLSASFLAEPSSAKEVVEPLVLENEYTDATDFNTEIRLFNTEIQQLRQQVTQLETEIRNNNVEPVCYECAAPHCGNCRKKCRDCSVGGWYSGYSAVFIKPHLKESFQAFTIDGLSGTQNLLGFSFDYDYSSRVWLGYVGDDGLGMRVQYWHYDHSADALALTADPTTVVGAQSITVIYPGVINSVAAGDVLSVSSGLQLQTLDLAGTQDISLGKFKGQVGGGLRYARLLQSSRSTITGAVPQALNWQREFEGVGPLASVDFVRPWRDGGLSFVGGFRAGLLFGTKTLSRIQTIVPGVTPPEVTTPTVLLNDVDEVTAGGELQMGLQWQHPTEAGDLFIRSTYEGQLWTDAGAPTLTFLGFEGFNLAVGFSR